MGVRAKFHISSIEQYPHSPGGKVTLKAVSRGDRNKDWAAATPSGELTMQVNNPSGFAWFQELLTEAQNGTVRFPEVFITIDRSTDDIEGAGHEFVPADVPETHYLAKGCAVCSMPREHHRAS